jgi:hypothetical protein
MPATGKFLSKVLPKEELAMVKERWTVGASEITGKSKKKKPD